ncbi:MAG: DUF5723 family protein [Bacteroidota bacterium]
MRKLVTTILAFSFVSFLHAQTSVSFLHLGDATFQNSYLNPSLIPKGRIYLGLPVLSGVHLHVNNKTSYNQTFTKEGGNVVVDVDKALGKLQNQNMTSLHANINLLHFGYKLKNGMTLSLMANERIEADLLYSKDLVDYLWNGNARFAGIDVDVSDGGLSVMHFREIGLGFAMPVNERLNFGVRGKFLNGFLNVSTPNNFKSSLTTSGEAFQLSAEWENFAARTAGRNIYSGDEGNLGSHLLFNQNLGVTFDIGTSVRLSKYYSFTASLLDVGFIRWKEDILSESLADTTFRYDGVPLEDLGSIRRVIEDSLVNAFRTVDNFDPYTSWLPTKAYGSWIYHYGKNTDIYFSGGARYIQRELKLLYGLGITQKVGKAFVGSISATKLPQQFVNLGAALTVHGGPVQFYMAADQIISFSVPDAKAFDFRFGMNFIFGRNSDGSGNQNSSERLKTRAKGIDTNVFLGERVKTKKREGVYSIIKKQKDETPNLKPPGRRKRVIKSATGSNPYFPKDYKKLRRKERKLKKSTNRNKRFRRKLEL